MRHVYLPIEHSVTDLVLAGQVAERMASDTLFVTWSPRGYRLPECQAVVRPAGPVASPSPSPTHGLLTEVLGTMAAFLAAKFAPRPANAR